MKTKDRILGLLEQNRGVFFSGEELARKMSVSRAAIWKAVTTLRGEGYPIEAVTNRGYCLAPDTDILSAQGISKYLDALTPSLDIHVTDLCKSTNDAVKQQAICGRPEGYTLVSNAQTSGRGRYGRVFFSPEGTGAYWSILLRPIHLAPSDAVQITAMAAVAMCEAIEEVSNVQPKIKWVNDILIDGKKVCGILTEGAYSIENGTMEYVVLGIGANIYPPMDGFPAELSDVASSIADAPETDLKNRLLAAFLRHFWEYYQYKDGNLHAEKYRAYSCVIGRQITVSSGNVARLATVEGIDDQCRLIVRCSDGQTDVISYGEIKL